ncbi:hypothetical protein BDZ45DRAFT_742389 [Acephala macrosclerotiorum]|nr:hypothetical protein BDZ45DRAFT_742389 [Acephala macrosclerotiorum]
MTSGSLRDFAVQGGASDDNSSTSSINLLHLSHHRNHEAQHPPPSRPPSTHHRPHLACLQVVGVVTKGTSGGWFLQYAYTIDNWLTTCESAWGTRIDQDGHFSLTCLPGYVYAFAFDATFAWYANPVNAFPFSQTPVPTPISQLGEQWTWQENLFGC